MFYQLDDPDAVNLNIYCRILQSLQHLNVGQDVCRTILAEEK